MDNTESTAMLERPEFPENRRYARWNKLSTDIRLVEHYVDILEEMVWAKRGVDALNEVGPGFATLVAKALMSSLILALGRLLDAPTARKDRFNLSLQGYLEWIKHDDPNYATLQADLMNHLTSEVSRLQADRRWKDSLQPIRHWYEAHSDMRERIEAKTVRFTVTNVVGFAKDVVSVGSEFGRTVFSNWSGMHTDSQVRAEAARFVCLIEAGLAAEQLSAGRLDE
ncbi:MAG: hypothetical protein ACKVW3_04405 [Phycisphaerales bacterium]